MFSNKVECKLKLKIIQNMKNPTQTELMQQVIESMNNGGIQNLTCDFTGWNIAEVGSNIYYELKRGNDLKERELDLREKELNKK
jgi:hypothetical protein